MSAITSKNLKEEIESSLKTKSWIDTYNSLKERIFDEDPKNYWAIGNHYYPHFIYYAIEKEIPQQDFDKIINSIYEELPDKYDGLGLFFNAFFNERDTDLTFKGYLLEKDNDEKVRDKLFYTFLDKENNKFIFNKKRLPYLLSMLEKIPENKIESLHEGKFSFYCAYSYLASNIKELEPILNLKNPAFLIEKEQYFGKLNNTILLLIGNESYEKSAKINKENFKILSEIMPSFENTFLNSLYKIKKEFGGYTVDIDAGLTNFAKFGNINIFDKLVELHKESLRKTEKEKKTYSTSIVSAIEVYFREFDITKINFNNINLNEDIKENFVHFPFFKVAMKQGTKLNLSDEVIEYFEKNIHSNIDIYEDENYEFRFYIKRMSDELKKYFSALKLEKELSIIDNKVSKAKPKI